MRRRLGGRTGSSVENRERTGRRASRPRSRRSRRRTPRGAHRAGPRAARRSRSSEISGTALRAAGHSTAPAVCSQLFFWTRTCAAHSAHCNGCIFVCLLVRGLLRLPSARRRRVASCRVRTRSVRSSRVSCPRRRRRTARTSGGAGRPGRPLRTAADSRCGSCSSRSRCPARSPWR